MKMVIKLVLGENCVRARGASFSGCSEEATELRIKQSDHYLQLNIGWHPQYCHCHNHWHRHYHRYHYYCYHGCIHHQGRTESESTATFGESRVTPQGLELQRKDSFGEDIQKISKRKYSKTDPNYLSKVAIPSFGRSRKVARYSRNNNRMEKLAVKKM